MKVAFLVGGVLICAATAMGVTFSGHDARAIHEHIVRVLHGQHGEHRCPLDTMVEHLELGEDQKREVAEILRADLLPALDGFQAVIESHLTQFAQLHEIPVDDEAVREACRESARAMEDLTVRMANLHARFYGVLSEEQRESHGSMAGHLPQVSQHVRAHLDVVRQAVGAWADRNDGR